MLLNESKKYTRIFEWPVGYRDAYNYYDAILCCRIQHFYWVWKFDSEAEITFKIIYVRLLEIEVINFFKTILEYNFRDLLNEILTMR